jgi:nitrite reductase (NADH) small subunit
MTIAEILNPIQNKHSIRVCDLSDLVKNSGVCALVEGIQVAIFQLVHSDGKVSLFATSNWDPIGKANVMYRGILGSIGDVPVICSPLYKQHYSLITGDCFENDAVSLKPFECEAFGDDIFISVTALNKLS